MRVRPLRFLYIAVLLFASAGLLGCVHRLKVWESTLFSSVGIFKWVAALTQPGSNGLLEVFPFSLQVAATHRIDDLTARSLAITRRVSR